MNFGKLLICLSLPLLFQSRGVAEDSSATVEPEQATKLENDYRNTKNGFDQETRTELTRIAQDKSLAGEAKIIAIQNWFASRAGQIETINRAAEQLDKLYSVVRSQSLPQPVSEDTPEARKARQLQAISWSYAKREIDLEEFDRLRTSMMAGKTTDKVVSVASPLPKPPIPSNLDIRSSEDDLASQYKAHALYLASLPADAAFAELSNPVSPINRLRSLLQIKKQKHQP